jgi:hypothetical protein
MLELAQQRREFNRLQRADSCFPTTLGTEALYTGILVCLKDRCEACLSNAFGEIFHVYIAPTERRLEVYRFIRKPETMKPGKTSSSTGVSQGRAWVID